MGSELTLEKQLKVEAEAIMQQLMTLVHYTAVSISSYCFNVTAALKSCSLRLYCLNQDDSYIFHLVLSCGEKISFLPLCLETLNELCTMWQRDWFLGFCWFFFLLNMRWWVDIIIARLVMINRVQFRIFFFWNYLFEIC